jgi:hypothetical protein
LTRAVQFLWRDQDGEVWFSGGENHPRAGHPWRDCGNRRRAFSWLWLLLTCILGVQAASAASWHSASEEELRTIIPARAPVISERIETEFRTASGIVDGKGHAIAGVVLITAGYSADGKYSHYFVSQVPLKVGGFLLPPGQYLIGWVRGQDSLQVTFYLAQSGKPLGQVEATRNLSITRVESFRIWPPGDKPLIQLGRFTFNYALAAN